jgi:hypothetical protein
MVGNPQSLNAQNIFMVGTISSTSGTNPNNNAEEVITEKGFGRFFNFRDFYSFISSSLKKKIINSLVKSNSLRQSNSDCEYGAQAINHSPSVDGSGVAADTLYLITSQIVKQYPAVECTEAFVNGTICLSSETDPKSVANSICISDDLISSKKRADQFHDVFSNSFPTTWTQNNPIFFAHAPSVGCEARDCCFKHGGSIFYVGMKNIRFDCYSQIDYLVLGVKRAAKQELLLNRGRLIYTRSGLFGVNYFDAYQFDDVLSKFSSAAKPPWIKSNPSFTT